MIDPQRVEDAKRALGEKLAKWRNARGLTQLALAGRVPISRTTVAGVEGGRQCPDRIFWQRCEIALSAGGELLAGYDDYRRLKQFHDRQKAEAAQRARWGEVEDNLSPTTGHGVSTIAVREPMRDSGIADITAGIRTGLTAPLSPVADIAMTREEEHRVGDAVTLAIMSNGTRSRC
jgi:transcriptional regulator with XRE-family HTH domain